MKVILDQKELVSVIGKIEKVVNRKSKNPILSCVKLTATNNKITITANNLESAVVYNLNYGETIEKGDVLISADDFKLLSKMKDDTIAITEHDNKVVIGGNRTFEYCGIDPSSFPEFHSTYDCDAFTINSQEFKNKFKIKEFCSKEDSKRSFQGVCIHQDKMWASDTYYGAEYALQIDNNAIVDLIIPRKAFDELEKVIGKDNETLTMKYHMTKEAGYLSVCGSDWCYMTRLIVGSYCDLTKMFPQDTESAVTVKTDNMLDMLDFAKTAGATGVKYAVCINTQNNKLHISCMTPTKHITDTLEAEVSGQDITAVYFDVDRMQQCIKYVKDNAVTLKCKTGLIAFGNENERYLIATVRK